MLSSMHDTHSNMYMVQYVHVYKGQKVAQIWTISWNPVKVASDVMLCVLPTYNITSKISSNASNNASSNANSNTSSNA